MILLKIFINLVSEIDHSGNDMVDQFLNGRSSGPIQLQVAV